MSRVFGLNHVAFNVPDVMQHVSYYESVLGLHVVDQTDTGVFLGARSGSDAVLLSRSNTPQLTGLAFYGDFGDGHDALVQRLRAKGLQPELKSDPHPGIPSSVTFKDLNGLEVELLEKQRLNAPQVPQGVAPLRVGHCALVVPDVQATCAFYEEVLGFRVSDWIGDYFVFMRCGPEHHTVNFIRGDRKRMHHFAFEMQSSAALIASCDVLAREQFDIIWGPVRHGPGHNIATYHKNPAGQIVELYAEMDIMTNESLGYYDPRPWHRDRPQRPKIWRTDGPRRDVWGPLPPADFLQLGV
jgi:catechol 2,3-dioxygenase-like lactoylglutathione lyase family enzyme